MVADKLRRGTHVYGVAKYVQPVFQNVELGLQNSKEVPRSTPRELSASPRLCAAPEPSLVQNSRKETSSLQNERIRTNDG